MENEQEERLWCIYKHTNKTNGKVYIGQTKDKPKYRWNNGKGYKGCTYFWRAICKYGWENFEHEIIYNNLTKEEADRLEIELIEKYESRNREKGYNIKEGGSHGRLSEETKKKISEANIGEKNHFYGKHHSKELKKRFSEDRMGSNNPMYGKSENSRWYHQHLTEEVKLKISESLSGDKNPNYGKHLSEEHKEKLRKFQTSENNKECRPVYCVEQKQKYRSAKDAGRENNIDCSAITKCCRGKRKTAGGFHWKYATE